MSSAAGPTSTPSVGVLFDYIAWLYKWAMQSDAEQLAADLDQRVVRLWQVLVRRSFRELSRTAVSVLAGLRDSGPQRITELAAGEGVAQPTMTNLVGRLERDGLVERTPDPDDGRAARIAVTSEGLS